MIMMMRPAFVVVLVSFSSLVVAQFNPSDFGALFSGPPPDSTCISQIQQCGLNLNMPYANARNPEELFAKIRSIKWGQHCRSFKKAFKCFRGPFSGETCNMNNKPKTAWQVLIEPAIQEALTYACQTEYKGFKKDYQCLATMEFFQSFQSCLMTKMTQTGRSQEEMIQKSIECEIETVKSKCGSEAANRASTLNMVVINRVMQSMQENQDRLQSAMTGNDFTSQLMQFKQFLFRR